MKGEKVLVYFALFAIFIATTIANERVEYKGHQVIKYETNSERYLEFLELLENESSLLHSYEIWHEKKVNNGNFVQFDIQVKNEETKIRIEEISNLKQIKIKEIERIHSDLGEDILQNFHQNHQSKLADPSFFSAYRTLTEINEFLSDLEIQFPDFVKLFSIGQSIEGRDIYGITITSPSGSANKPQVVYNSCQHAREWISPMTTTYVAYYLLANYTTNSTVQSLLDSFEYSIIPVVNVDGYEFTWSNDRLWRKNRREDERCYGVDNNRNWGYEWGLDSGSSPNQCSETYRGSSPFSEPEETSLSLYISSLSNVIAYIDFHSYGYDFVWAWGYSSQLPPENEEMQSLGLAFVNAVEVVHGTVWTAGNSNTAIYPTSGSAPDWTYGQEGIVYSYTCELRGNSFILPPSDILLSGSEIFEGVVAMGLYLQNTL